MCHDDDSRAPAPPVRGEVAAHGGLTLTSADGTHHGAIIPLTAETAATLCAAHSP